MKSTVAALSDENIAKLAAAHTGVSAADQALMADTLKKRRDALAAEIPKIGAQKAAAAAAAVAQQQALGKISPVLKAMPALKTQDGHAIAASFAAGKMPHHEAGMAYAQAMPGYQKVQTQGAKVLPKTAAEAIQQVKDIQARGGHFSHYGSVTQAKVDELGKRAAQLSFSHAAHLGDALAIIDSGFVGSVFHGHDGNAGDKANAHGKQKRQNIEEHALGIWNRKDHGKDTATTYGAVHPMAEAGEAMSYHNDGYGSIKLVAHPRVHERTVFHNGDTWSHDHGPTPSAATVQKAQSSMLNQHEAKMLHAFSGPGGQYIEALPVGGYQMEDVHEIHAPNQADADKVRAALDKKGHKHVSVYIASTGTVPKLHSARTQEAPKV